MSAAEKESFFTEKERIIFQGFVDPAKIPGTRS